VFSIIVVLASTIVWVFRGHDMSNTDAQWEHHRTVFHEDASGNMHMPIKVFLANDKNTDAAERWLAEEDQSNTPYVCLNQSSTDLTGAYVFRVSNPELTIEDMTKMVYYMFPHNEAEIFT
jgi:hypothetical protein